MVNRRTPLSSLLWHSSPNLSKQNKKSGCVDEKTAKGEMKGVVKKKYSGALHSVETTLFQQFFKKKKNMTRHGLGLLLSTLAFGRH